jgi:peptide/nickel transport system permease protein
MSEMAGINDNLGALGGSGLAGDLPVAVTPPQLSTRSSWPAPASTGRRSPAALWRQMPLPSRVGLVIFLLLLLAGFLAPLLPLSDPLTQQFRAANLAPSLHHLLGTDYLGRDVFSRTIYGARSSYEGVAVGLLVTMAIGIPWGLLAGFGGSVLDEVLMRAADGLMSFPGILLALGFISALGPSLYHAMIAIGVVNAPAIARLLRSTVLPIRSAEFVLVSGSLGASRWRIALRHVLPNAVGPVVVQAFSLCSIFLIVGAGLSFLGFGVQPPAPSWGSDLVNAYQYFINSPFATVVPGIAITIAAWSLSAVGDGVRELLVLN